MRRSTLFFIVLSGLLVSAWAWWRYLPDTLPAWVSQQLPRSPVANPPLYKWRDAKGLWHVTDQPPDQGPYTEVHLDPNLNVLPNQTNDPEQTP